MLVTNNLSKIASFTTGTTEGINEGIRGLMSEYADFDIELISIAYESGRYVVFYALIAK